MYLSTRLDSDDALPLDAMWRIQHSFSQRLRQGYPRFACWKTRVRWQPSAAPLAPLGSFSWPPRASYCLSAGLSMSSDRDASVYGFHHNKLAPGRSTTNVTLLDDPRKSTSHSFTFPPLMSQTVSSDSRGRTVSPQSSGSLGVSTGGATAQSVRALSPAELRRRYGVRAGDARDANRETLALAGAIRAEARARPAVCLFGFQCNQKFIEKFL